MEDLTQPSISPLVTVVTPAFNQGRFIRDTIENVLAHDYPRVEHIVVDGGSTDETLAVLKSYGDRLWRYSEPDRVKAYAVNKGTARATGDWLCFPGADDYWIASTRLAQAASGLKEFGPRYLVNEEKQ